MASSIRYLDVQIYVGCFIGPIVAIGILAPIIASGVYVAKFLFDAVHEPGCSQLELRVTYIWSGLGGIMLIALLGAALWLSVFGPLYRGNPSGPHQVATKSSRKRAKWIPRSLPLHKGPFTGYNESFEARLIIPTG